MSELICIYHGNCADGFGAAYAVWKKYGGGCTYHPGKYGEAPPDVTGMAVIMVDFSYKRDVILQMAEKADSILILDHHKTAEADLAFTEDDFKEGDPCPVEVTFDMEKSGAVLAWEHFHPDTKVPRLLQHVQDRDLWRFALEGTKEIQAAVFSYNYEFVVWDDLVNRCERNGYDLIDEGTAIMRKQMKDICEFLAAAEHTMVVAGHRVPALNAPYFWSSEAGHIMCEGAAFAVCYWRTADGWTFSLRSHDDGLDVSEIALQYGGGGHRNAAGFQVTDLRDLGKYKRKEECEKMPECKHGWVANAGAGGDPIFKMGPNKDVPSMNAHCSKCGAMTYFTEVEWRALSDDEGSDGEVPEADGGEGSDGEGSDAEGSKMSPST